MPNKNLFVTPSPNEIAALLHEQTLQRRKLRLQQVRVQNQSIAKNIRQNVDCKRRIALQDVASELNKQLTIRQQKEVAILRSKYSEGLSDVGKAHSCAANTDTNQVLWDAKFEQKKAVAKKRYCDALKQLHMIKSLEEKENIDKMTRRNLITNKEKVRAKRIAMLPKPEKSSNDLKTTASTKTSASRSTTQSSLVVVERATQAEKFAYDAQTAAILEQERFQDMQESRVNDEIAQREKAKFRHQAALQQTRMQNEYRSLENDLRFLQQKDARRRRENIPVFPHIPALDVSLQDLMA